MLPDLRIVDCTWFMPDDGRDPRAEYEAAAYPASRSIFDIDDIADTDSDLPHMLPSPTKFSARVRKLGLGDGVTHRRLRQQPLLRLGPCLVDVPGDGPRGRQGARWRACQVAAEGRPVDDMLVRPSERHFTPRINSFLVRDLDQMRGNLTSRREQVVDTRSAARFAGSVAEPRPGLKAGHIPGATNVPASDLVAADGTLKDAQALGALFAAAGVDLERPITTSCGSGVSAAVANLALARVGKLDAALYDGSWTEWGSQPDTPIAR